MKHPIMLRLFVAGVLLAGVIFLMWTISPFPSELLDPGVDKVSSPFDLDSEEGFSVQELIPVLSNNLFPDSISRNAIGDFEDWMARYLEETTAGRELIAAEGVRIAQRRRVEMKALIVADPELALLLTIPYEIRRVLPQEVIEKLETPVSSLARFELLVFCPAPGQSGGGFERIATIGENQLNVFTYGRRLDIATKDKLSVHGIAIDDVLAMAEDPVRVLSETEREDRDFDSGLVVAVGANVYSVLNDEGLAQLRTGLEEDELSLGPRPGAGYSLLQRGEVEGVTLLFTEDPDREFGLGDLPETQSDHTEGPKTMLYIRARFSNQAADYEPNDLATLMERQAGCEAFWFENSYGKSSLTTTFTDTITLPNSASYYADQTSGRLNTLYGDALPLVKAAGTAKGQDWDEANYDFYTMITTGGSWGYAGVANVGGRRSHLNGAGTSQIRTASHEFGHNLGLLHANYWRTDSPSPIGRDSIPGGYVGDAVRDERIEYGHKFSVMSAQNGGGDFNEGRGHYTTGEKVRLDWLVSGDNDWVSVDSNMDAPIRLYRHDVVAEDFGSMIAGVARAIKINADSGDYASTNKRRYWLSYRRLPTNGISETWLRRGLQVDWQRENYGGDGSILLDMTPYTRDDTDERVRARSDNNDKEDAVVVIGRTYSDELADIHFTPIAQGGENPNEWMDVIVNIGTQNGNRDPLIDSYTATAEQVDTNVEVEFAAAATDADGDTVYYTWTFGDNSLVVDSLNSSNAKKSWSEAGFFPVRVTASDGKGGSDTKEIIVQVGSPTDSYSIQGRLVHAGLPVEGARVNVGNLVQAWTARDGRYVLPGLGSESFLVKAAKEGLTFEPHFPNPVYLTELNAYGRDFVAIEDGQGTGSLELTVIPFENTVPLGAQIKLKTLGWDGAGASISTSPSWSVTGGGTISETGTFSANEVGGPFTVTATLGFSSANALVTIVDVKAIGVVAQTAQVSEPGTEDGLFRIRRYGDTEGELTVQFSVSGSASSGLDFVSLANSATISHGFEFVDVSLNILDDFHVESTEEVILTLQADSSYTIYSAEASATIEILDDSDMAPIVNIISPTVPLAIVAETTGLFIQAEVIDDGFPNPPGAVTESWSVTEAPEGGIVLFSPPRSNETVATFSVPGFYRIQISASDGVNTGVAELAVHAGVIPGADPSIANEVVYYDMDEGSGVTATDARGGDNNGTLVSGASWTAIGNGISGTGILFDGVDDQVNLADSNEINLLDHSVRSIALWFKADDPLQAGKQVLYEEGGGTRGLNIYLEAETLYVGGWNNGGSGWEETYLSTDLLDTAWHHVGLVLNAQASNDEQADAFKGFLDGLEFGSGGAAPLDGHGGDIALGANRGNTQYHDGNSTGSGDHFAGIIDEFHLWNRALSAGEMGQLYSRKYIGPGLILNSVAHSGGSVVIPGGMGIVLNGRTSGNSSLDTTWTEVISPEGGKVIFRDSSAASTLATFSKPGFYKLRFAGDDGIQKSAIDMNVHAGLDSGANPPIEKETIHYSMDEGSGTTTLNSILDGYHGELNGGVGWTNPNGGILGTAAVFQGDDEYIRIPPSSGIGGSGSQKSFAMWIKPAESGTGNKEVIFEQGDLDNGLDVYLDGDILYFGGWGEGEPDWSTFLTVPIGRDNWHHLALVLNVYDQGYLQGNGLRAYFDGTLVASGSAGYLDEHHNSSGLGGLFRDIVFHDGTVLVNATISFSGLIDEFHYYNDYALSIDEIGKLYAFGNIGPIVNAGPDQPSVPELTVSFAGGAIDDGRWESPLVYEWMISGRPGAGTFNQPNENETEAQLTLAAGGTYHVILGAFDGQVTTFDELEVTVNQPTYFDLFMDGYPSVAAENRGYLSNPDNDLWTNIEEYGFGGAPDSLESHPELRLFSEIVSDGDELYFEFRFPRRLDAALRGLNYELQLSINLSFQSWSNQGYTEIGTTPIDENFEEVRIRVDEPMSFTRPRIFGRVRVEVKE